MKTKGRSMLSRRSFLRSSALLALSPTVPGFLALTASAAEPKRDGRVLLVIELNGGNDGINTIVPFADEGYARHRKHLRLPTDRLLKINDCVGFHPAMRDAAKLLETGRLAIVQGVGYPNPNRSHFQSMAIWQTARLDPPRQHAPGWIGTALDNSRPPDNGAPASLLVGLDPPPTALLMAGLLKVGFSPRVFYTTQGSYDTHFTQLDVHAGLLAELAGAIRAFLDDLEAAGLADRVAVMTFSEFGRRVAENGSYGTDHGTAAPLFLAGKHVKAGLFGQTPSLVDLQDGDLKMSIDFRRVYATVLEKWLELPAKDALGGVLEPLPLFAL
jgi:uncharacterized protein (DUF1501 family)